MRKNWGIHRFLCPSWVLITMAPRNRVVVIARHSFPRHPPFVVVIVHLQLCVF